MSKKIALIFVSGTALSSSKKNTILFVQKNEDIKKWIDEIPEIMVIAEIIPIFFNTELIDLTDNKRLELAELILSLQDKVDGIVIFMSADLLIRESLYIAYMLGIVKNPIIFTGSVFTQMAIEEGKVHLTSNKLGNFGLKSNVINAVQVATKDFMRVAIMYGNLLLDPVKTQRKEVSDLNIFDTIDKRYFGKVGFGIQIDDKQKSTSNLFLPNIGLSSSVLMLDVFHLPLFSDEALNSFKILIIKLTENQKLSSEDQDRLRRIKPVVLAYNFWYVLDQGKIATISGITEDTLMAKCRWLAGTCDRNEDIEHGLQTSYLGETTIV